MDHSSKKPRIAAIHLKHMMNYAMIRGVPEAQMLELIPCSIDEFQSEEATVQPKIFYAVFSFINQQLKDKFLGIRAGRYLNMKALGLIYQISLEATTIEEAFFYLNDYLDTTFPIIEIKTQESNRMVSIQLHIENNQDVINRIILENMLMIMQRELQIMTGKGTQIELFSPFHLPKYPDSWNPGDNYSLQFKSTVLQAALKDKSRMHLDILIPEYLSLIEGYSADASFVNKVKIAALNLSKPELPDQKTVAQVFNITPRTLQRRLSAEETTFRDIINELKQMISDMLLRHKPFSIGDISFVLGYSEPAAFIHTFKKWHGIPPQEARKRLES